MDEETQSASPESAPQQEPLQQEYRADLPEPVPQPYSPFSVDLQGWWLCMMDMHIPYHDKQAAEAAVREGKKNGVVGVLLNGDILDFHTLSVFDHDPTMPRYHEEILLGRQFLKHLRYEFPHAEIIYKEGNHEERVDRYLMRKAPELYEFEELRLPSLLRMGEVGVRHVGEKRVIRMGKHLNWLHGHEYTDRQIASPVNPARGLFLKTKGIAACGHHHQTSEHHEPSIGGKQLACWSVGCLAQLTPFYRPLNKWGHGFALVHVDADGGFHMRNLRILNGKIL